MLEAGHWIQQEKAKEVNKELLEFIVEHTHGDDGFLPTHQYSRL